MLDRMGDVSAARILLSIAARGSSSRVLELHETLLDLEEGSL